MYPFFFFYNKKIIHFYKKIIHFYNKMNNLINRLNEKNIKELRKIYYKMTNKHINQNKKNIIKELLKPFGKIYKMENTHKYFTTDDLYLQNTRTFFQVKRKREDKNQLITLLGESHNRANGCIQMLTENKLSFMSMEDYIRERLNYNSDTVILLEIDENANSKSSPNYSSFNIRETWNYVIQHPKLLGKNIKRFNIRYVIKPQYRTLLYHDLENFYNLDFETIKQEYIINPYSKFLQIQSEKIDELKNILTTNEINYLKPIQSGILYDDIDTKFINLLRGIPPGIWETLTAARETVERTAKEAVEIAAKEEKIKYPFLRRLRTIWVEITDWRCLTYVFSEIHDCIIISGNRHTINYIGMMKDFNKENIFKVANNEDFEEIDASNKFYNNLNADSDPITWRKKLVDCINLKYTLK
jgi:hypothetical protein